MKKFLFIVPLTPSDYLTPLRSELFKLFLSALKDQTYAHWQALLLGEEEKTDGNILYKKVPERSKERKLTYAYEYISSLSQKPDYIIRLDDDDLISPDVLERVSATTEDFDCYADKYHCYYDVVSGKICQVKNSWLPNTIIHRTEHALAKIAPDNLCLFLLDHSIYWMEYYSKKKIFFENKITPVYLRIMSPTSSSSQMRSLKLNEFSDETLKAYWNNIEKIGHWRYRELDDFIKMMAELRNLWRRVSGRDINIPANKHLSNLKNRFTTLINNLSR
jgi:glycosyltransferase involved in cell wall biosynthesis